VGGCVCYGHGLVGGCFTGSTAQRVVWGKSADCGGMEFVISRKTMCGGQCPARSFYNREKRRRRRKHGRIGRHAEDIEIRSHGRLWPYSARKGTLSNSALPCDHSNHMNLEAVVSFCIGKGAPAVAMSCRTLRCSIHVRACESTPGIVLHVV
jgi:hypothetical protein